MELLFAMVIVAENTHDIHAKEKRNHRKRKSNLCRSEHVKKIKWCIHIILRSNLTAATKHSVPRVIFTVNLSNPFGSLMRLMMAYAAPYQKAARLTKSPAKTR